MLATHAYFFILVELILFRGDSIVRVSFQGCVAQNKFVSKYVCCLLHRFKNATEQTLSVITTKQSII